MEGVGSHGLRQSHPSGLLQREMARLVSPTGKRGLFELHVLCSHGPGCAELTFCLPHPSPHGCSLFCFYLTFIASTLQAPVANYNCVCQIVVWDRGKELFSFLSLGPLLLWGEKKSCLRNKNPLLEGDRDGRCCGSLLEDSAAPR